MHLYLTFKVWHLKKDYIVMGLAMFSLDIDTDKFFVNYDVFLFYNTRKGNIKGPRFAIGKYTHTQYTTHICNIYLS